MIGTSPSRLRSSPTYHVLNEDTVVPYLRALGIVDGLLGGSATQWRARECGDGNLNLVFVVAGSVGAVVVKQALPYVRMVGESWPLSVRRNFFEHSALREQARWAAHLVPAIHHVDDVMALIVMQFLTPHAVLRAGLIGGRMYPRVGVDLGLFLAKTLFNTSDLRLSAADKKARMAVFLGNTAMCRISEDLIFDEPYFVAPMNWHTSPQLNGLVSALRGDTHLKVAVQGMKARYLNQPECLLHGDLHTGSVMISADDTRVIDPEFAFYGPMGFDIGVLLANFLISYLAQPNDATPAGEVSRADNGNDRKQFRSYLLDQVTAIWETFAAEFSQLWYHSDAPMERALCNPRLNDDASEFATAALAMKLRQIWEDAMGFAGCEIIRRVVGLAHVADFQSIADPDQRAACEQRAVRFARDLLTKRAQFGGIGDLVAGVESCG